MLALLDYQAPSLQVQVIQRETAPALEDLHSRTADLVVGIGYDSLPLPRHRDIDRRDDLREDILLALAATYPFITGPGPVALTALKDTAWAAGHRGTGLDAMTRNICNRLGGYEPDVQHRSDDALVFSALVASGRPWPCCPPCSAPHCPSPPAGPAKNSCNAPSSPPREPQPHTPRLPGAAADANRPDQVPIPGKYERHAHF